MSTKIYDGIQIKANSIIELNQLVKEIRKKLVPIAQKEYYKLFAKMICQVYSYKKFGVFLPGPLDDCLLLSDVEYKNLPYHVSKEAIKIIKKNQTAETIMEYTSDFDLNVTLSVFPMPDGRFLGIPFIANELLRNAFYETPEIVEYGYWNNVDMPDSVSAEEWEQREKDWDIALPGVGRPIDDGFQYKILDMNSHLFTTIFNAKNISDYFDSNETLRHTIAKIMLRDKKFDDFKNNFSEQHICSHILATNEYVESHPEEVEEIEKSLDVDINEILNAG